MPMIFVAVGVGGSLAGCFFFMLNFSRGFRTLKSAFSCLQVVPGLRKIHYVLSRDGPQSRCSSYALGLQLMSWYLCWARITEIFDFRGLWTLPCVWNLIVVISMINSGWECRWIFSKMFLAASESCVVQGPLKGTWWFQRAGITSRFSVWVPGVGEERSPLSFRILSKDSLDFTLLLHCFLFHCLHFLRHV